MSSDTPLVTKDTTLASNDTTLASNDTTLASNDTPLVSNNTTLISNDTHHPQQPTCDLMKFQELQIGLEIPYLQKCPEF